MAHALTADNALGNQLTVFIYGSFAAADTLVLGVVRVDVFNGAKDALRTNRRALAFEYDS